MIATSKTMATITLEANIRTCSFTATNNKIIQWAESRLYHKLDWRVLVNIWKWRHAVCVVWVCVSVCICVRVCMPCLYLRLSLSSWGSLNFTLNSAWRVRVCNCSYHIIFIFFFWSIFACTISERLLLLVSERKL